MAEKILVKEMLTDAMIEAGAELIRKLDEAGMPPDVALWMFDPEVNEWRLLFSAPGIDTHGRRPMYDQIHVALDELGDRASALPGHAIGLLAPHAELVRSLKAGTRTGDGVARLRFKRNVPGGSASGSYIDDALIYRVA